MASLIKNLLLCLLALTLAQPAEANDKLVLGVFAFRPREVLEKRYQALADYLSAALGSTRVELQVLNQNEIEAALARNQLDLVFTNPSHYVVVRNRFRLTGALATLISLEAGQASAQLGGVIIAPKDAKDLNALADLKGRKIAIPGTKFLGGYQTQVFELVRGGINPQNDVQLKVVSSHDAVVKAVLNRQAEAGFIRTGMIEQLQKEGKLDPAQLRIINQQHFPNFPYLVSTQLYPEWAFVALPHVDSRLVRKIASSLMSLEADHPAAQAAGIAGFSPPADYLPVENIMRVLHSPPFDQVEPITLEDIWKQHRSTLIVLLISTVCLTLLLLLLSRRNRQLQSRSMILKEQEERFRSIFEQANAGIAFTDSKGHLIQFNDSFARLLDYPTEELQGMQFTQFTHPDDLAVEMGFFGEIVAGRRIDYRLDKRYLTKSGGEKWVDLSVTAIRNGTGKVHHFVGLAVDITESKRNKQALVLAREAAEAASRAKSEFLANMSHEIRTPMNGLLGMTQLLLDTSLDAEQQEYARIIYDSANTLLTVLDDILDFSKIEAGHLEIENVLLDLPSIVRQTMDLMATRAREKGLELNCHIETALPNWLKGDSVRLRQILLNLLGNAIKFTNIGEITLKVKLLRRDSASVTIGFEVQDTGIGIPPNKIQTLFTAFTQGDASMTRRFGGTGLGLSICRRLVGLMGGEIGVDSQEGIGSTFWFHIPFGYAPPPMSASPATDTGTDLSRSTRRGLLLLVEDNVVNQKIAVAMLVKQGHIVDVAQNGEQALSLLAIRPYDLVLMDCHMPVMDGYEATRRLRANDPPVLNPCVPVIAMTASALIEDQQRCIFTGMNDFISKPFKAEHLHQIVGRFLEKHPHDTALFNPTPSIWSDNKPVPCLERYGHI